MIGLTHALCLALLTVAGIMANLGSIYYGALVIAAGIAVYQQTLIKAREPGQCFKAFLNNNWFGATVFAGLVMNYLATP